MGFGHFGSRPHSVRTYRAFFGLTVLTVLTTCSLRSRGPTTGLCRPGTGRLLCPSANDMKIRGSFSDSMGFQVIPSLIVSPSKTKCVGS